MKTDDKDKVVANKKQDVYNVVITWLVIISLFISTLGLGLVLSIPTPLKGDKGDMGEQGIQGVKGIQGLQGIQGLHGVNGSKGDKGEIGSRGYTGPSGPSGRNGIDCIPNDKPVITLVDMNGSRISKCTEFTFWINVSITDSEQDDMQIDFFYSEEANGSFIRHETFFGTGGYYNTSIVFEYPYLVEHKVLFFQVVAWDGSDISLGYFVVEV